MTIFAVIVAVLLLAWLIMPYRKLNTIGGFNVILLKLSASALGLVIALAAAVVATLSAVYWSWVVAAAYGVVALVALFPAVRSMATRDFANGMLGENAVQGIAGKYLLRRPWGLRMPGVPTPRCERDVPFWTPPGSDRPLLCDVWMPPDGVTPSGLAYIYFHGSAWVMLDKDYGTAPIFRRLAAQGHVVMDVAYRLYPEADMEGMVGDVRRAVAWMKANAARYRVSPDRIVIGGSSAGGHISLVAAYTEGNPLLTPEDVQGMDTSVQGVISCYGPADMRTCYAHMCVSQMAKMITKKPDWNAPLPPIVTRIFGEGVRRHNFQKAVAAGRLDWILDGTPETVPDRYALLSPVEHVHPGCPPTLLMQATDDLVSPVEAIERLAGKLRQAGVPVTNLTFPHSDHMFDLIFMRYSPAAWVGMWYMERFLALVAAGGLRAGEHPAAQAV